MDGTLGRVEDTALMDAIQEVQLYYAKADVSFASLFNQHANVPQGTCNRTADRSALCLRQ